MFFSKTLIKGYYWLGCRNPSSIKKSCSQVASFVVRVKAIYLASLEKKATIGYLSKDQLTGFLLSIKIKFKVDF